MAKKKPKFYVVWEGEEPGIYTSWEACQKQTNGYSNPKFKSFSTLDEAEFAFEDDYRNYWGKEEKKPSLTTEQKTKYGEPDKNSLIVDGACSGANGPCEYRGCDTLTGAQIFHQGPYQHGSNNIAEFLALVHALAYCAQRNLTLPIYSDSRIAITWVKHKHCRTNVKRSEKNKALFELIDRAVRWLQENSYPNKILKWETEAWGENPADFGRK